MTRLFFVCLCLVVGAVFALGCSEEETTVSPTPRYSESGADTFQVGGSVSLRVDHFAGGVTINTGAANGVRVDYTKWASHVSDLAEINIAASQVGDSITVVASNPSNLKQASVDFEFAVPSESELVLAVSAGNIESYIRPAGKCSLIVAAGNILIELPSDIGAIVHLSVGAGNVSVDFPVNGGVTSTAVEGTIGAGDEVEIWGAVAAGNIQIIRQTPTPTARLERSKGGVARGTN